MARSHRPHDCSPEGILATVRKKNAFLRSTCWLGAVQDLGWCARLVPFMSMPHSSEVAAGSLTDQAAHDGHSCASEARCAGVSRLSRLRPEPARRLADKEAR